MNVSWDDENRLIIFYLLKDECDCECVIVNNTQFIMPDSVNIDLIYQNIDGIIVIKLSNYVLTNLDESNILWPIRLPLIRLSTWNSSI